MKTTEHLTRKQLEAAYASISPSPKDKGRLEMIVARPGIDQRVIHDEGTLDVALGLVGDGWHLRDDNLTEDGSLIPETQIALMNSRIIHLVSQDRARWPLAGDQLYVDLDISAANLPPGQRLSLGESILEITDVPHTPCRKFANRYGRAAVLFISPPEGKAQRMRGVYARVIQSGRICAGDLLVKC